MRIPKGATPNPNAVERRGELQGYGGSTTAVVVVESFDRAGRWRRAVRGLAQCWGIAILCVFIPVAHFFLVPGFAIAGVVVFWVRRRTSTIVIAGQGSCPDCGAAQALDLPSRWSPSLDVDCRHCHRRLRLTTLDA